MEPKKIETKELFTTFCVGVGAIAASRQAGEVIRDVLDKIREK